jgi:serine/threonine protein kinase
MSTLQVGDSIGRFRIQAIIGEGALGTIYRAWDPNRRRLVAIKELSAELKARNPTRYAEYLERFRMERRIQSQLVHLRIVAAYEPMKQGETEYLITEYLDGGTLADLIKQEGSIPPERVIEIGIEMCQAIAAAWERDIVHCDINPGNILLTSDGRAKLAGFGTAQVGKMSHRSQTYRRHPGTPTYMSPEQEEGRSYLDERSDLYSLGLVLYEALTGKPYKHERVPVRRLTSKVPAGAEKAVMRALEHEVGARYQSAAAFETALRQALDSSRCGRPGGFGRRWRADRPVGNGKADRNPRTNGHADPRSGGDTLPIPDSYRAANPSDDRGNHHTIPVPASHSASDGHGGSRFHGACHASSPSHAPSRDFGAHVERAARRCECQES